MTRIAFAAAAALLAMGASGCGGSDNTGGGGGSKAAAPKSVHVNIASFKFVANPVHVAKGGTVTWTNRDAAPHTATAESESIRSRFDTGTLRKGEGKAVTFSSPGSYKYVCLFHPFMTGTVIVE